MRILIVKMSSLGDIIHTLPAVSDVVRCYPEARIDWVVEDAFREVVTWHNAVHQVIPVAFRRWKRAPLTSLLGDEWKQFRQRLRRDEYDVVIDAQGLMKSAFVTKMARAKKRVGFDRDSVREKPAAMFYDRTVAAQEYIIPRMRHLFASALDYPLPDESPDFGIGHQYFRPNYLPEGNFVVFLHGTTWPNKHWPEGFWRQLVELTTAAGFRVCLPWGNADERSRARRLASGIAAAEVLPRLQLAEMAAVIQASLAVVGLDSGLSYLAAALAVPSLVLYGPTQPPLPGDHDEVQFYRVAKFPCAPCFQRECTYTRLKTVDPPCFGNSPPREVWHQLQEIIEAHADY